MSESGSRSGFKSGSEGGGLGVKAALAATAPAAQQARCCQQQKRRGQQKQEAEPSKDANHLCPVPDDRCPRVAQLVLARPLVVMPQEEVIVERGEAVPAEDVSAALAHHLCAALVPLYGDAAPGAALDQARLFSGQVGQLIIRELPPKLVAGLVRMPAFLARRAEGQLALGTVDG